MSKVTVVGAGAVGATCANVMACREVASEVVLIDIKEGLSEGKMLDMYQCSTLMDFDTKLVGATNDYKKTANSDVVVITSGIPRKPGMTREELIGTNAGIMKGVIENVIKYSPRAIIIVVANPMDTLTYLALKASGLPKNRIIGMGGALDSSRFKCYLAKATGANINNVDGMVIGGHVTSGKIVRGAQVRLVRDGIIVADDKIASLRRFKDDVKEVADGYDCGITLERFSDIKLGDVLEAYEMEEYRE